MPVFASHSRTVLSKDAVTPRVLAGRRSMNVLRQALADYLAVRRALGYRLARAEKLLAQFLAFVEHRGEEHLTIETALAWATAPAGADPSWMSRRLSDVRRFAIHLRGIDPATQVPPADILPGRSHRATLARDRGWSTTWELRMVRSRAEMMERAGRLFAEYAEFQRGRPDLPQGDLLDLSEEELEILVTEFQRDRATEEGDTDPTPPRPLLH